MPPTKSLSIHAGHLKNKFACLIFLLLPATLTAQSGKPENPATVAKIQGDVITLDDLNKYAANDFAKLDLERAQFEAKNARDKHQILEVNLARLLEDRLLEAEAAKRKVTKQQLLDAELQGKVKEITDADVQNFYDANKQRINQPLPQIESQIRNYLKTQNYNAAKAVLIEQLKQSYGVMITLQPLRFEIDTTGSPSMGPADAPVTLIEFSDFECPYCTSLHATLRKVLDKYGPKVRLVYRNFPLAQLHPNAEKAAEASLCAADQGSFWEMHDLLFQSPNQLKDSDLKAKAAQLKLDVEKFNSCLDSGQKANLIRQDLFAGARAGVTGTPALFVNGRFLPGAVPLAEISKIIDEELNASSPSGKHQPGLDDRQ